MKNSFIAFVLVGAQIASSVAMAAPPQAARPGPTRVITAKLEKREALFRITKFLNAFSTVGKAFEANAPTKKDLAYFRQKYKAEWSQPMPSVAVENDRLVMNAGGEKVQIDFHPETAVLSVNGKSWRFDPMVSAEQNMLQIEAMFPKKTAWELIPSARAAGPLVVLAAGAVIYLVGAAGVAIYCGAKWNWQAKGAALLAPLVCAHAGVMWPALAYSAVAPQVGDGVRKLKEPFVKRANALSVVELKCPDENQGKLFVRFASPGKEVRDSYTVEMYSDANHKEVAEGIRQYLNSDSGADKETEIAKVKYVVKREGRAPGFKDEYQDIKNTFTLDETYKPLRNVYYSAKGTMGGFSILPSEYDESRMDPAVKTMALACADKTKDRARLKEIVGNTAAWFKEKAPETVTEENKPNATSGE